MRSKHPPRIAIDPGVDQCVMPASIEGRIIGKALLDGLNEWRAEWRERNGLEDGQEWRVGQIECIECNAEQVEVVAMIVGHRHTTGTGRTLHGAEELVQLSREVGVRKCRCTAIEERVNDRPDEVCRLGRQRIALRIELEATAVADERQRDEFIGEGIGPFSIDEEYQGSASCRGRVAG